MEITIAVWIAFSLVWAGIGFCIWKYMNWIEEDIIKNGKMSLYFKIPIWMILTGAFIKLLATIGNYFIGN